MLTAYQVEVVAFFTEGDIICRDCAINALDEGEADGLKPVIRYTLDEYHAEGNEWDPEDFPRCTGDCIPYSVNCGGCLTELVEPYHYGHADEA